ncbi:MAG: hypothetical protein ACQSGP_24820, partial [Frankia sp.]
RATRPDGCVVGGKRTATTRVPALTPPTSYKRPSQGQPPKEIGLYMNDDLMWIKDQSRARPGPARGQDGA